MARLNPNTFAFTALLGSLAALPPLAIDMGLPGIPAMEAQFADASGQGALTLSLFLLGFAISPLTCGPLADRFGRRPMLLAGLLLFTLTAAACAFAPSFNLLLACRLLQGLAAGACVILPVAIVRDLFEGAVARSRLSQVTSVLGIAPMIAPLLGAWAMHFGGWRSTYTIQAIAGLALLIACTFLFAESLPHVRRRSLKPSQIARGYLQIASDRNFITLSVAYAFGFACMFSYISGAPAVVMGSFGLSGPAFSVAFGITASGVLIGSLISLRLAKRAASHRVINFALAGMVLAAFAVLALAFSPYASVYTLLPLILALLIFFGMFAPSITHEALRSLGNLAGSAVGVQRSLQMAVGAGASALTAYLQPYGHPLLAMGCIMVATVLISGGLYLTLGGRLAAAAATAPH